MHSALYEGWVRHRRHEPVRNAFRYRLYMLYLDLAEIPRLFERRPLWSGRGPSLAWYRRKDYLGDPRTPLDEAVRDLVEAHGETRPRGPIRMLTQVRTLGYVFNPVTFYYCFDAAGRRVETIVAHITNTPWLERHAYVLHRAEGEARGRHRRFRFAKAFHVSPFMQMAMDYDWTFTEPGERLGVHMDTGRDGRSVLDATLALVRRPFDRRASGRILLRHPLMTFKITAAIYWQALRLWWKRCPFVPHPRRPGAPEEGTTHVRTHTPPGDRPAAGSAPSGSEAPAGHRTRLAARP